jgi:hypothetical protein
MHDARWHAYPQYEAHTASVPRSCGGYFSSPSASQADRANAAIIARRSPAVNTTLHAPQRAPQPFSHRARRLHCLPPPQHSFPVAGFAFVPLIMCSQFSSAVQPPIEARPRITLVLNTYGTLAPFVLRSPPPRITRALNCLPRRTLCSKSAPIRHPIPPISRLHALLQLSARPRLR